MPWQHLAMMGLLLLCGFVSLYALHTAMNQKLSLAAYITIGIVGIYLPLSTLFWSGSTLAYTLGIFIFVNALAQFVLLWEERLWAFSFSLVTAALPAFFDAIPLPWLRYDVTQWIFTSLFVYSVLAGGLILTLWHLVVAYQRIKSIGLRLGVTLGIGGLFAAATAVFSATIAGTIIAQNQDIPQSLWLTIATYGGVSIATTMVSVLLVMWVSRGISRRLKALSVIAGRIAEGEVGLAFSSTQEDEISEFAQAFTSMSVQTKTLVGDLEQRLAEHTRTLLAVAEVSRITTTELDQERMIEQVVNFVKEQFYLYYVGLFLVEDTEAGRFAVLHAGTGDAGRQMLAEGWHLPVGGESMIGQCISTGLVRVKQTELDIIPRFANTYLPDTQSELALPLHYGSHVIGAMTIQSDYNAAFDETIIALFRNIADQVTIAIENARLFAETQIALERMRFIQQRYQGQAWREYLQAHNVQGYEQRDDKLSPLGHELLPEVKSSIASGGILNEDGMLLVPIMQSGQVVGVLGFEGDDSSSVWSEEQIALLRDLSEQLGLTAENRRLLDTSQQRAAHEQLTREITAQLRQRLDVNSVAQEAAQALRQALDAGAVTVRLGTTEQLRSMQSGEEEGTDG